MMQQQMLSSKKNDDKLAQVQKQMRLLIKIIIGSTQVYCRDVA